MDKPSKDFLFTLLNTPSPTGFETPGLKVWAKEVRPYADTVQNDAYGNTWATLEGTTEKVLMLEAHADEIGFIVKHVSEKGFISIDVLGGSDAAVARGKRVLIHGDKDPVPGIIGNTAIHLREDRNDEKVPKVHELFVDVGAKDNKEVEQLGIRVGHPVTFAINAQDLGKHCVTSRALDNRIGGFIIAQVLKKLSGKKKPSWTIHFVNSVQEEIGCFGARMTSYRLKPHAAVVFDVTHATDSPGIKHEQHSKVEMNGGPTLTHAGANHPLVVGRLMKVAKTKKIAVQHEASSRYSGNDASVIYFTQGGIPCALVSTPLRYMHSVVETVDLRDVEKTIDLLVAFVESLTAKDEFSVKI